MPHTPEIDAIHPVGKIPAMRHGDVVLAEPRAPWTKMTARPGAPTAASGERQLASSCGSKRSQAVADR
jgi:hypothetical protein